MLKGASRSVAVQLPPNLVSSYSYFLQLSISFFISDYQINNLVPSRTPNITQIGTRRLELSWQQPSVTPLTTIFVIEQKTNIYNTSVVHMIGWVSIDQIN